MDPINSFQTNVNKCFPPPFLPPVDGVKDCSTAQLKAFLSQFPLNARKSWADSKDKRGKTALAIAIEADKFDTTVFLVKECGADVNLGDKDNWTPL